MERQQLMSLGEAARHLGLCRATVRRVVENGQLSVAKVTPGGHRRFDRETVEAYDRTLTPGSEP